jgi:hypothetical protein
MRRRRTIAAVLCAAWGIGAAALTPAFSAEAPHEGGTEMTHAKGTFEVDVKPIPGDGMAEGLGAGRLSIHKRLVGELEGTSVGEMLASQSGTTGSAGYVAIERMSATLEGRSGSFVLLHRGTMKKGADFKLEIVVVPDSGTDQLAGLTGSMEITIVDGAHFYDFEYSLPDP